MRVPLGLGIVLLLVTATAGIAQTRITKVSPATLQIQAGGDPVPLTLEGVGLASVTSVRALLGRRPVTGLEGALRTAAPSVPGRRAIGSANRLVVDLAATEAVQPGRYQLEVVAGRQRILVPVSITVVEATAGLQPPITVGGAIAAPTPLPPRSITVEGAIAAATPVVARANPTEVRLKAAGPAQTVALQGTHLDLVSGVRIQRNGQEIPGVRAQLSPGTATLLVISLSAVREFGVGVPWDLPLDLMVEGPHPTIRAGMVTYPTPVKVNVLGTLPIEHEFLAKAMNNVLAGVRASFNSCGSANHRFSLDLPGIPYSAGGALRRHEHITTTFERIKFLNEHTLPPVVPDNDGFYADETAQSLNHALAQELPGLHPSSIPHTLSAVRICLMNLVGADGWNVTGAGETGGSPYLTVTVGFNDALFRVEGMLADPTGMISVGSWGGDIADSELPDRIYASPQYEIRLPLEVSNGAIRYGSPDVTLRSAARWTDLPVLGPHADSFLGPSAVKTQLEEWAASRMQQIGSEIHRAFEAPATRGKIESAIQSMLRSVDVTEILGLEKGSDGKLQFLYR